MTVCYKLNNGQEIIDNTNYSFDRLQAMKSAEKKAKIKRTNKKRKEFINNLKFTLGLTVIIIAIFGGMCFHWLYFGY